MFLAALRKWSFPSTLCAALFGRETGLSGGMSSHRARALLSCTLAKVSSRLRSASARVCVCVCVCAKRLVQDVKHGRLSLNERRSMQFKSLCD